MSKILSNSALKALNRIGNIMIPKNGDLPTYSDFGGLEHVDALLEFAPEADIKDLNMALSILGFMPGFVLHWLVNKMGESNDQPANKSVIFRQLNFGLKGIILSTYYTEKKGSKFTGKTPLEVIGYDITRVL